jgi:hypothetical protein
MQPMLFIGVNMKDRNYTGMLSDIREQPGVVIALSGPTIQTSSF